MIVPRDAIATRDTAQGGPTMPPSKLAHIVYHGPTTSMYYTDTDGSRIELQIDNFATAKEGQDWMLSPAFAQNPIGVEFAPDELVAKFKSGVPVAELVVRG